MVGRVGRPVEASKTLDEALERYYAGELPKRPRNAIERGVMSKQRGRKTYPNSPTQIAAQYAAYLVTHDGAPLRKASRIAATANSVSPDSVRKLTRKLLVGPQSKITLKMTLMYRQLAGDGTKIVPFVVRLEDLPEFPA